MQVDDVGAHTIQEVLGVGDEHKDSPEPGNNKQDDQNIILFFFAISMMWSTCRLTF